MSRELNKSAWRGILLSEHHRWWTLNCGQAGTYVTDSAERRMGNSTDGARNEPFLFFLTIPQERIGIRVMIGRHSFAAFLFEGIIRLGVSEFLRFYGDGLLFRGT